MTVDPKNLFVFDGKPLKFTIIEEKIFKKKVNDNIKEIKQHGGLYINYEERDKETIVLAREDYSPSDDEIVFKIKYVKSCTKRGQILSLKPYSLKSSKINDLCTSTTSCRHFTDLSIKCCHKNNSRSPEEDIKKIKEILFS